MLKSIPGFMLAAALMLFGCSNSNQQTQTEQSNEVEVIAETDSMSNDLSSASDSVEQKVNDLQSTLENLNN